MAVAPEVAATAFADTLQHMFNVAPVGWLQREAGVLAAATGVPVATLNGVWIESLDPDAGLVAAMFDRLDASQLPYCLQVRPGISSEITDQAFARGMQHDHCVPVMVLEDSAQLEDAQKVTGLSIRRLEPSQRAEHIGVAAAAFGSPEELFDQLMTPKLLAGPGVRCYVGDANGQSVTTGVGTTLGAFVGVFNIATLSAHRGRGYGAAMTAHVIYDGLAAGAEWAWLQSSPAGYNVYERLGFRTVELWDCWVLQP
jgi:GNAT superfamily N-acetyltransferase